LSKIEIPNETQDIGDYYNLYIISEFKEMIVRASILKFKDDKQKSLTDKVVAMIELIVNAYKASKDAVIQFYEVLQAVEQAESEIN